MNKDKLIFSIGIFVSLIIIGVSGFLFFKTKTVKTTSGELRVTSIQTPEATQKPYQMDYKNIEIQVLNGTGKAGLAKTFADKLEKLGFVKVTTGNYTETITGNLFFAPTDFGKDINLENYRYQKSESIKIVIGIGLKK